MVVEFDKALLTGMVLFRFRVLYARSVHSSCRPEHLVSDGWVDTSAFSQRMLTVRSAHLHSSLTPVPRPACLWTEWLVSPLLAVVPEVEGSHPQFCQLVEINNCLTACESLQLFPYVVGVFLCTHLVSSLDSLAQPESAPSMAIRQRMYALVLRLLDQVVMAESSYHL